MMGDLTTNFSRYEFKCPCCGQWKAVPELVEALQEYRDLVGVPVYLTTRWGHAGAFRCKHRNLKAGGVKDSHHLYGEAADVVVKGMSPGDIYKAALQIPSFRLGGIGVYPQRHFVHLDIGAQRRWGKIDGKPVRLIEAFKIPEVNHVADLADLDSLGPDAWA